MVRNLLMGLFYQKVYIYHARENSHFEFGYLYKSELYAHKSWFPTNM